MVKKHIKLYTPIRVYKTLSYIRNMPAYFTSRFGINPELIEKQSIPIRCGHNAFDIIVDPKNGLVDKYIFQHRAWEKNVTDTIMANLNTGDVFVDIGANIGFFSLLASKIVGPQGHIYSFEPIPSVHKQLRESIALNKFDNITTHMTACGVEKTERNITTYKDNIGKSSLINEKTNENTERLTIQVSTLDTLLEGVEKINIIKIDVEGFEFEVLRGAQKTIQNLKPILIVEFNPSRNQLASQNTQTPDEMLVFLQNMGYEIHSVKGYLVTDTKQFAQRYLDLGQYVELLCVPKSVQKL